MYCVLFMHLPSAPESRILFLSPQFYPSESDGIKEVEE